MLLLIAVSLRIVTCYGFLQLCCITAVVVGVNMTNVNFIERIYARRGSGSIVTDQARGSAERHFDLELSSKELLQTGALVRLLFLVRMIALKNLMGIKDNA